MEKKSTKERGITLIALVITIIILLILSGITISAITGENGIITKTQMAKEQNKIAELTEKLNLEKVAVQAEKWGKVTLETYIEKIKEDKIVEDDDIEDTENEKSKYIIIEGYIFLVEDLEDGEIRITYQGKAGKLFPEIQSIIVQSTSNSITVKAEAIRALNIT